MTNKETEALKDEALELFITERERVAAELGVDRSKHINFSMLQGIDAEANERIRMRLLTSQRDAFNEGIEAAITLAKATSRESFADMLQSLRQKGCSKL